MYTVFPYFFCRAMAQRVCCILLALAFIVGAGPAAMAETGPLSAVTTAQKAIDTSDMTLFHQAVDIDSILHKGSTDVISVVSQKMQQGELTKVNPMLALALTSLNTKDPAQVEMLRTILGGEIKNFISAGVSGGYFAGKPNGKVSAKSAGTFGGLLKDISKDKKELIPGKVLSQKGDSAKISATLVDHDAGRFPLELGVVQKDGRWCVNEVANTRALMTEALKTAK